MSVISTVESTFPTYPILPGLVIITFSRVISAELLETANLPGLVITAPFTTVAEPSFPHTPSNLQLSNVMFSAETSVFSFLIPKPSVPFTVTSFTFTVTVPLARTALAAVLRSSTFSI